MANVFKYLPRSVQCKTKTALHEIRMATTRGHTEKAFEQFVQTYEAIYPKTVQCLVKDELTYSRSVAS